MTGSGGVTLTEELMSWDGVSKHPHRFGGIEFQLNGKEIGHLHGNSLFDLLSTKSERDRWIEEGKAQSHHMFPDSNWVSVYLNSEQDVAHAIEITRYKFERMQEQQNNKLEGEM
ncbi:DUF5519 family protein [Paenibacillus sp. N1-5-1-14]|uniref:luciferase domain-containing protein n=1 Tax=Paenibacillus radicibacter TaxID=2972488 RepID=UPI0021595DAC|nr:luciferase family protein [Paenibacillus radicibacter]MCR8645991.1 DUF5519 family protein [Paenibacillus radicibacter]